MKASVNSIESFGTVDGPGIRTVVFFNECHLRCLYCHNPETWHKQNDNMDLEEVYQKIIRNKDYFGDNGGVTFSGGEPLLHHDFLVELCKKLKKDNIHIALDTAGVGYSNYDDLLPLVDLIILDIKHVNLDGYLKITRTKNIDKCEEFIKACNKYHKNMWIRQVVVPGITDSMDYFKELKEYLKKIDNIKKIEFLPYHKLGEEKYKTIGIPYPLSDTPEMDKDLCQNLYDEFIKL